MATDIKDDWMEEVGLNAEQECLENTVLAELSFLEEDPNMSFVDRTLEKSVINPSAAADRVCFNLGVDREPAFDEASAFFPHRETTLATSPQRDFSTSSQDGVDLTISVFGQVCDEKNELTAPRVRLNPVRRGSELGMKRSFQEMVDSEYRRHGKPSVPVIRRKSRIHLGAPGCGTHENQFHFDLQWR